jgi:oxysterol-binding protein-related protein 3/6/7
MNLLTDELKAKLPPTDARHRPDIRYWEDGKLEESTAAKTRLEVNQRNRKKSLKE